MPMTHELRNRTALVTGSTSGIGEGIARALAAHGANVAFNGFGNPQDIASMRQQIERDGAVRTAYFPVDVADPSAVQAMIDGATAELGPIDILVNSAGVNHLADVEDLSTDQWNAVLAVHLSAAFHTIRLVVPSMKARNWGRIVNVASVYGLVGGLQRAAYSAAKHGLVGLTKVVALETAAFNVTCNAICPGLVSTPPVQRRIQAAMAEQGRSRDEVLGSMMERRQPSGRLVETEDVAALAAFLCQESAREIRGAALPIDGAWAAR